eukprot:14499679-Heterocapsa_arctica.AAC.1
MNKRAHQVNDRGGRLCQQGRLRQDARRRLRALMPTSDFIEERQLHLVWAERLGKQSNRNETLRAQPG